MSTEQLTPKVEIDSEAESQKKSTAETQNPVSDQILVGIPAYNEEIGIGSTILAAQQHSSTVVVVDDGSVDNTVPIATQTDAIVLEHRENVGKGGAVQTIFDYAHGHDFDALVLIDGDGQHVPEEIPDVAKPVLEESVDMAIGSRYIEHKQTETPLYRRFGQRVLDVLTTGSTNSKLTDTQSGFRAFSPKAVEKLTLSTNGIGVESEMISEATDRGLEMAEVPIEVRYEGIDGQTYNPLQHGLTVVAFMVKLIRDRHPLLFFGVPGILLLVFGGGIGLQSAFLYQTTGAFHQWRAIIGGFGILIGMLCLFSSLILDQIRTMVVKTNE
jgi:glycosyltransferase involved in cell wall biosynthesis